ncbi:cupin domain-containing protein [Salipaludibacillus sp. CF4.18]|uniref:cupin domain-containing protein n=1 Tax=Salipaludibacillus sp. CF4.18 TaxID=3373081 RepID=UPI003EE815F3
MKKHNVNEFIEYGEDRFTKRIIYKEKDSTAFVLNFKPGQSLPAHKHPGSTVYLMVLHGNGEFTIDGETVSASVDDVFKAIGSNEEMAFENTGNDNTSLYVQLMKIPDEKYARNI